MNSGFTVLVMIVGIAVSAYGQDVAPGRPGVVEVTIFPSGTLFTNGKGTGAAEFGNLTPVIGAVAGSQGVSENGPSAEARLTALSVEAHVFPEPLCEDLPEVGSEVKTWVAEVAPELASVRVRELPEMTAVDVFGRAAAAGWGSVDVLTHAVFREPCTFYFSREALRALDAAFELDLVTPIQGQDKEGQDFEMTALLAGRGQLVVLYDRDGIVYKNERLARSFKLASRVEFETPAAGALENVQGLCAKVPLSGCVRVRSLVKVGKTLIVQAGRFTSKTPLKPIQARGEEGSGYAPDDARPSGSEAGGVKDLASRSSINAGRHVRPDWVGRAAIPAVHTKQVPP